MGIFTELGILYAKFKPEKLMEHLKLFGKRLNIPRLIRVCEEQGQWRELVHLYIQYDEYDNAANCMMQHSSVAWEHVTFKDVVVKVSNVDVYYKGIRFYLQVGPASHTVDSMQTMCLSVHVVVFWLCYKGVHFYLRWGGLWGLHITWLTGTARPCLLCWSRCIWLHSNVQY